MVNVLETAIRQTPKIMTHVSDLPKELLSDKRGINREACMILVYNSLTKPVPKPMNYKEIAEKTGLSDGAVTAAVSDLMMQNEVSKFRLYGGGGNGIHNCLYLFGDITDTLYFYRNGKEKAVAEMIVENLPLEDIIQSKGTEKAVSMRLMHCLQPDLYSVVQNYYLKVCRLLQRRFRKELVGK